jgi:hypothetical protein
MVIIEAVKTGCWSGLCGGLAVETVRKCVNETADQRASGKPGYVEVTDAHRSTIRQVHDISLEQQAIAALQYTSLDDLDPGEQHLLIHILTERSEGENWSLCAPDLAMVRAMHAVGLLDHLCALEDLAGAVGERPRPPLRDHFCNRWLGLRKTNLRLHGRL